MSRSEEIYMVEQAVFVKTFVLSFDRPVSAQRDQQTSGSDLKSGQ